MYAPPLSVTHALVTTLRGGGVRLRFIVYRSIPRCDEPAEILVDFRRLNFALRCPGGYNASLEFDSVCLIIGEFELCLRVSK